MAIVRDEGAKAGVDGFENLGNGSGPRGVRGIRAL